MALAFQPLSSEQKELQALAYKAAQQIIGPTIAEDDRQAVFRRHYISEMGKLGLTGIATPLPWGGAGLGYFEYALCIEEIAKISTAYAISIAVSGLPQIILNRFASPALQKKYIPPLASGQHIGAFSLSESGSGSDAASLKTKAEKKGAHYILNGTKLWTTQGNEADTIIVFARTSDHRSKGISAFLVEKNTPGFRAGKVEHKMGLNASPTCELILENVEVSAEQLIGQEGEGLKIALTALDSGRITIGATAVGLAQAALSYAVSFLKERQQFNQALIEFQGLQFMLADLVTKVQAARLLVHQAAGLKDQNQGFTQEAAMAKLFATETAMTVTTEAVQLLGGVGYTQEYPVERYMREAKVLQIVEGTNQIQKIVIARSLIAQ